MAGTRMHRPARPRRTALAARVIVATLFGTLGIMAAPVVSTGSGTEPIEPTIVEDVVTAEQSTVVADFDLAAVVLDPDSSTESVEVRVRDSDGWGEWTTVGVMEDDAGPDQGTEEATGARNVTEPVLAADSSEIEVRVPDGESAEVVLIDGGAGGGAPTGSASAAPLVVSREDWGADDSLMPCTPNTLPGYEGAVVHHTVNANTYTAVQAPALVRSIYAWHTTGMRWCDIGYQFLVDRFGTIYEGRSGSLEGAVQGAQSAGFNAQTFGVSIIGEFTSVAPSAAALGAVDSVIQWQLGIEGVDPRGATSFVSAGNGKYPEGTVVTLPNVMGHRDNGQTACPGDALYALLPTFRKPLADPAAPDPRVERHAGADRYATSARISAEVFSGPVPVAYVASGTNFPDALSGAPAAASLGGPLLITHPDVVPAVIAAELTRLQPQRIVVLGSNGAVSDEVAAALQQFTTGSVDRLGGPDRFATSALVSAGAFAPRAPVAFIATGLNFPDALSGGPAAAVLGGPLLLTLPGSLPEVIAEELSRLQPGRIVVLGAHPTVTDEVVESLRRFTTGEVTRLAGPSRYDTSALTSAAAFSAPVPVVYLATGRNFPDALSGAPAAGALGGPLLVTHPDTLSPVVAEELRRLQPQRIVVLGSHPTMSHRVQLELGQYLR